MATCKACQIILPHRNCARGDCPQRPAEEPVDDTPFSFISYTPAEAPIEREETFTGGGGESGGGGASGSWDSPSDSGSSGSGSSD